jgi:hypothetical protein
LVARPAALAFRAISSKPFERAEFSVSSTLLADLLLDRQCLLIHFMRPCQIPFSVITSPMAEKASAAELLSALPLNVDGDVVTSEIAEAQSKIAGLAVNST